MVVKTASLQRHGSVSSIAQFVFCQWPVNWAKQLATVKNAKVHQNWLENFHCSYYVSSMPFMGLSSLFKKKNCVN